MRFAKNNILLRERYRRFPPSDPRKKLLEKDATVRLKSRRGWRHAVQNEQPLEYEVEELKPPLPPWRGTKFKFDEVKLERSKEQYTVEELRKKADMRK